MNVEQVLIRKLGEAGRLAYADVPNPMPASFVTVERAGGGDRDFVDRASIAVQCWADGRKAAADMADEVRKELEAMTGEDGLGAVTVQSVYNWPDTRARKARYQMTVGVVAHI